MARFLSQLRPGNLVSLVGVVLGLLFGDVVMAAIAYFSHWLLSPVTAAWPMAASLAAIWLLATVIIAAAGYGLALPALLSYWRGTVAADNVPLDGRMRRAWLAFDQGLYLVGSLLVGAPGVAAWYSYRRDPMVHRRTIGAALIMGATMAAFWTGVFDGTYLWWALGALVLVIGVIFGLLARAAQRAAQVEGETPHGA